MGVGWDESNAERAAAISSSSLSALPVKEKHSTFSMVELDRNRRTISGSIVGNIEVKRVGSCITGEECCEVGGSLDGCGDG